jgi:hypothetical protein
MRFSWYKEKHNPFAPLGTSCEEAVVFKLFQVLMRGRRTRLLRDCRERRGWWGADEASTTKAKYVYGWVKDMCSWKVFGFLFLGEVVVVLVPRGAIMRVVLTWKLNLTFVECQHNHYCASVRVYETFIQITPWISVLLRRWMIICELAFWLFGRFPCIFLSLDWGRRIFYPNSYPHWRLQSPFVWKLGFFLDIFNYVNPLPSYLIALNTRNSDCSLRCFVLKLESLGALSCDHQSCDCSCKVLGSNESSLDAWVETSNIVLSLGFLVTGAHPCVAHEGQLTISRGYCWEQAKDPELITSIGLGFSNVTTHATRGKYPIQPWSALPSNSLLSLSIKEVLSYLIVGDFVPPSGTNVDNDVYGILRKNRNDIIVLECTCDLLIYSISSTESRSWSASETRDTTFLAALGCN